MSKKKITKQPESQLDLFNEQDSSHVKSIAEPRERIEIGESIESGPAKVIQFTPNLSDIYDRILNRTMS